MKREKFYEVIFSYVNGISSSIIRIKDELDKKEQIRSIDENYNNEQCIKNLFHKKINHVRIESYLDEVYQLRKKENEGLTCIIKFKIRVLITYNDITKMENECTLRYCISKKGRNQVIYDKAVNLNEDDILCLIKEVNEQHVEKDKLRKVEINRNEVDLILTPQASGYLVHEIIGHPLEQDFFESGISAYTKQQIGSKILCDQISIVEKPMALKNYGIDFGGYDDEGNTLENIDIIRNGILLNTIQYKRKSNINDNLLYRMHNLIMEPNQSGRNIDEMIRTAKYAIIIDSVIRGGFNPQTKKYILYCGICRLVENGIVMGNIHDIIVEDEIKKLNENIKEIGCDFEATLSKCNKLGQILTVGMGAPSISIRKVNIVKR